MEKCFISKKEAGSEERTKILGLWLVAALLLATLSPAIASEETGGLKTEREATTIVSNDSLSATGEELVRQLWSDMKDGNMVEIERKTALGFQSAHQDGARNREQELTLIKGLRLGPYTLSDFKVSQNGPVIVTTYFVSVEETVDGKRLSAEPAPRLSVFLKTAMGYQWIAHANLKPLGGR